MDTLSVAVAIKVCPEYDTDTETRGASSGISVRVTGRILPDREVILHYHSRLVKIFPSDLWQKQDQSICSSICHRISVFNTKQEMMLHPIVIPEGIRSKRCT
jgi:hypothetical protein